MAIHSDDALARLLAHLASGDGTDATELLGTVASEIFSASDAELDALKKRLDEIPDPAPGEGSRAIAWLEGLRAMVDDRVELSYRGHRAIPLAELVRMVRQVPFREVTLRAVFAARDTVDALMERTGLRVSEVRGSVLWLDRRGLLRPVGAEPIEYELSDLGLAVAEKLDEPEWLSLAEYMLAHYVRNDLCGGDREALTADLSASTGTPRAETQRILDGFAAALRPDRFSKLYQALRTVGTGNPLWVSICPAVYPGGMSRSRIREIRREPPASDLNYVGSEGRYGLWMDATSEVRHALARAGLVRSQIAEEPSPEWLKRCRGAAPVHLERDRSYVCTATPLEHPVALGLSIAFGSELSFPLGGKEICWHRETPELYQTTPAKDFAVLVRFFDAETYRSHFLITGLQPSGTKGAGEYFTDEIERLLHDAELEHRSFAVLLEVSRTRGPRARPQRTELLGGSNIVPLRELDLRFAEPAIAAAEGLRADPQLALRAVDLLARLAAAREPELDGKLLARLEPSQGVPICAYARDIVRVGMAASCLEPLLALVLAARARRAEIDPAWRPAQIIHAAAPIVRERAAQPLVRSMNTHGWTADFLDVALGKEPIDAFAEKLFAV